jgi:hypothetical protein
LRKALKQIDGCRRTFSGTVSRTATKTSFGYTKKTLLLVDLKDSKGVVITDHLWFNLTKGFERLGLVVGDIVQFDARVKEYVKGYQGHRWDVDKPVEIDYKLSHPTKIERKPKING